VELIDKIPLYIIYTYLDLRSCYVLTCKKFYIAFKGEYLWKLKYETSKTQYMSHMKISEITSLLNVNDIRNLKQLTINYVNLNINSYLNILVNLEYLNITNIWLRQMPDISALVNLNMNDI
jgi:hypothetical protein